MLQPAVDLKEDSDEEKVRETTVKHKIKVSVWIQQGQTWFIFLVCIALFPSVCLTTLPVLFLSLLICHCGTTGSLPLSSKFKSINGEARTLSSGISWDVYLERILNKDKNNMIKGKKKISTFLIVGRTYCIYRFTNQNDTGSALPGWTKVLTIPGWTHLLTTHELWLGSIWAVPWSHLPIIKPLVVQLLVIQVLKTLK